MRTPRLRPVLRTAVCGAFFEEHRAMDGENDDGTWTIRLQEAEEAFKRHVAIACVARDKALEGKTWLCRQEPFG